MKYHFTSQAQLALNNAKKIAKACQNSYIGTEHLLLGILKQENTKLEEILKKDNVTYDVLYEEVVSLFGFSKDNNTKMEYTCTMDEILQQCLIVAYQNQKKLVDIDCLTLCLLEAENNVANELLRRFYIDVEELKLAFKEQQYTVLDSFKELKNLNLSQSKNPTKIVKREEELETMIDILCRKLKANPLLIGEAGVGKSALVEELAQRINLKQVPEEMVNCVIYELNINSLVAGTKYRGEFEEKIDKLLETVLKYPQVILFIDEIHMMVHAGKAEGSIDVAGVLKPYLARGSFRCIGATTIDEYHNGIEKDRALKRRFQVIKIKEPPLSDVLAMLECKKSEYENHHQVYFPSNLIQNCLDLSMQYLPGLTFPDKAIDVMDLSCVKAKKAGLKSVDLSCIEETIQSISEIPYSFCSKIQEREVELREVFSELDLRRIIQRCKQLDDNKIRNTPYDIWYLQGNNEQYKRSIAELLAKIFLNHEKELTVLDGSLMTLNNLIYLYQKCKKNVFQVLYIESFDHMNTNLLELFQTVFSQGKVQIQDFELNLSHALIIIDSKEKRMKALGFVSNETQRQSSKFSIDTDKLPSKVH